MAFAVPSKPGALDVRVLAGVAGLNLEREGNHWVGSLDFALRYPGVKSANGRIHTIVVNLSDDQLEAALDSGLSLQDSAELGDSTGNIRIVVQDRATGAAGSVRISVGTK